jgi:hypothetical protein
VFEEIQYHAGETLLAVLVYGGEDVKSGGYAGKIGAYRIHISTNQRTIIIEGSSTSPPECKVV